jgi:hypothetical protein
VSRKSIPLLFMHSKRTEGGKEIEGKRERGGEKGKKGTASRLASLVAWPSPLVFDSQRNSFSFFLPFRPLPLHLSLLITRSSTLLCHCPIPLYIFPSLQFSNCPAITHTLPIFLFFFFPNLLISVFAPTVADQPTKRWLDLNNGFDHQQQ